jgi:hypothetical protein
MDHLYYLREQATGDVHEEEAVSYFAEHFGRVSLIETIRQMIRREREAEVTGD